MFILISYLLVIIVFLFFLIGATLYTFFLIYSFLSGAPYVATRNKEINNILKEAHLKKGKVFIELGCGDGRVARAAVKNYQVRALGVDINPILVWQAKFWAKIQKINDQVIFCRQNIFDTDLSKADYIYLFLLPPIIKKLTRKFQKKLKKNSLIISHGFKIEGWQNKLIKTLPHSPFPTYFYRFN